MQAAGPFTDDEWARFRDAFDLSDSVRITGRESLADPDQLAGSNSPAVQLATFLRTLDATRAAAMQLVFEMIDRAGAEKVVETLEAMKRMLTVTAAPGTLVHRSETIEDGYRVTKLSPHKIETTVKAAGEKPRAKKIGG